MYTIIKRVIVKTGKVGFWILLPLLLFSNAGVAYKMPMNPVVENGSYLLKTTDILDRSFSGQISFSKKIDTTTNGKPVTRLELQFDHGEHTVEHRLGLVISKRLSGSGDLEGYYDVKAKLAGFSSRVDGVFGFADVPILGEQPFFTDYGTVHITMATDELLYGKLNMGLRNFEGKNIDLNGSFIATGSK